MVNPRFGQVTAHFASPTGVQVSLQPQRDSNPCRHLERAGSFVRRRSDLTRDGRRDSIRQSQSLHERWRSRTGDTECPDGGPGCNLAPGRDGPRMSQRYVRMNVIGSRGPLAVIGVVLVLSAASLAIAWGTGSSNPTHRVTATEALCRSRAVASLPAHATSSHPFNQFRTGSISVRAELCQLSAVSGEPLKAVLVFTNVTDLTLATRECPNHWVFAGVVSGAYSSVPGVTDDLCRTTGAPYVTPGVSYMTIELPTFSSSCDRGATVTQDGTPPCTKQGGWPPALPLGRFRTYVQILGLPLRSSTLPSLGVSLVGCGSVKDCACSPVGDRPVNGQWVPFC